MNIYELLNKIVVNRRHSLSVNLFTEEAREKEIVWRLSRYSQYSLSNRIEEIVMKIMFILS